MLECVPTNREYVGATLDFRRRYRQHRTKPPSAMKAAWLAHKPFDANFTMTVLHWADNLRVARVLENMEIERLDGRGPNSGNILESDPGHSRKYWAMRRAGTLRKR